MDIVSNLILLYLRKGDRPMAQGLADHGLAGARDPKWSLKAEQVLERDESPQNPQASGCVFG